MYDEEKAYTDQVAAAGPIRNELDHLEKAAHELGQAIGVLHTNLGPVLVERDEPVEGNSVGMVREQGSTVRNRVEDITGLLRAHTRRVERIAGTLDL